MKFKILVLTFFVVAATTCWSQDFYSQSVKAIDGADITFSQFTGKKVIIYVLPTSADSSKRLAELRYFTKKYQDNVVVVGIPALDAGFQNGTENRLKKILQDNEVSLVLTEGMNVKKSSGQQSDFFTWLTSKDLNSHFNDDVSGVGHKFFINRKGELVAVLGPDIPLNHPFIDIMLAKQDN